MAPTPKTPAPANDPAPAPGPDAQPPENVGADAQGAELDALKEELYQSNLAGIALAEERDRLLEDLARLTAGDGAAKAGVPGAVAVVFTGLNFDEIEAACPEHTRLNATGPQICTMVGDDDASGWVPIHEHYLVIVPEDAPPFLLSPYAARQLGLL